MWRFVLKNVNNSIQNVSNLNLPSLSLKILDEISHNFTTCLKNSWAVISTQHYFGVGIKVVYFENRSMTTKMASCSLILGRWVMISIDTLSQGCDDTVRSSRRPATLAFSILSYWLMRHVLVYCVISSRMGGQKYPFFNRAYVVCHHGWLVDKVSWHLYRSFFLRPLALGTYNQFPFVKNKFPSSQNCLVFPYFARLMIVGLQGPFCKFSLMISHIDRSTLLAWIWANMHMIACVLPFASVRRLLGYSSQPCARI